MRNTVLAPPTGADSPQRGEMSPQATEKGAWLAAAAPLSEGFAKPVEGLLYGISPDRRR